MKRILVFLTLFFFCLPSASALRPDYRAASVISTFEEPVAVSFNQCRLVLSPHSRLLLRCLPKKETIGSVELLSGTLSLKSVGPRPPTILWQGALGLRPAPAAALLSTYDELSGLLPDRPVNLFLESEGATVIGPGQMPSRPLPGQRSYLLEGNRLLPLATQQAWENRPKSDPALEIELGTEISSQISISPKTLPFQLQQEDRVGVRIRTNDVYTRNSFHFTPQEINLSLDDNGLNERAATLTFEEELKGPSPFVKNECRTGAKAALRFVTLEGYIVVLGPKSVVKVETTIGKESKGTVLLLQQGVAMVLPPSDADLQLPERLAPLHFEGSAPFKLKHGSALMLADSPKREKLAPILASLHRRYRFEKRIFERIGKEQVRWRKFCDLRSEEGVPSSGKSTSAIDVIGKLAFAKSYNVPIFTPLPRLPSRVTAFLEQTAIHIDGATSEQRAILTALGPVHETLPKQENIATFKPTRLGNYLQVFDDQKKKILAQLHFFRTCLPGAKEDAKLTGSRSVSTYIFRDRSLNVVRPRRVLRPEEVGAYKKAKDWFNLQLQERPYRAACIGILVLALAMYILAKGPKQVLITLWQLLTFFRGEPCHRCGMPLEKFHLRTIPLDHHLAMPSRLIYYGGALSPQEFVDGLPAALDLMADVNEEVTEKAHFAISGDCVWCLRCRKGQVRFRLMEDGIEREEAKHPVLLPHFMEFLRRWEERAKR